MGAGAPSQAHYAALQNNGVVMVTPSSFSGFTPYALSWSQAADHVAAPGQGGAHVRVTQGDLLVYYGPVTGGLQFSPAGAPGCTVRGTAPIMFSVVVPDGWTVFLDVIIATPTHANSSSCIAAQPPAPMVIAHPPTVVVASPPPSPAPTGSAAPDWAMTTQRLSPFGYASARSPGHPTCSSS